MANHPPCREHARSVFAPPGAAGRAWAPAPVALTGSPTEFGKLIADETEKWGKVVRAAKLKAE
jgi:hypothetical protein